MLIAVDQQHVRHRCARCQTETAIPLDQLIVTEQTLVTPPCPVCLADGKTTVEHFRRNVTRYEAGEALHPQSFVGQTVPGSGGIVMEDTRWHGPPHHMAQCQQIRALHRHLGLPLHEDR